MTLTATSPLFSASGRGSPLSATGRLPGSGSSLSSSTGGAAGSLSPKKPPGYSSGTSSPITALGSPLVKRPPGSYGSSTSSSVFNKQVEPMSIVSSISTRSAIAEVPDEDMPGRNSTVGTPSFGGAGGVITSSLSSTAGATTSALQNPSKYTRQLVGFRNLGNTCFLNSILQCLLSVPPLANYFQHKFNPRTDVNSNSTRPNATNGQLVHQFKLFMDECISAKAMSTVNPASLRQVMVKFAPQFANYNQQDAHEALRFLLDGLHEDLNRVVGKPLYKELKDIPGESLDDCANRWWQYQQQNFGNSVITDIFAGQFFSETHCHLCDHRSRAFDTFLDLSLPFPNRLSAVARDATLTDCLREFTQEEVLEAKDYKCEKCKKSNKITKRVGIYRPPKVLVLHLKRFSWLNRRKIDHMVHFPITNLDIGEFVEQSNDAVVKRNSRIGSIFEPSGLLQRNTSKTSSKQSGSSATSTNYVYDLCGVSQHSGTMTGGHYTACCKISDHHWANISDAMVSLCRNESDAVDVSAYLLFYVRRL
ncbi:unnamed protein product [Amoebophrya sp. A120]|nr:unnamed protein product [Amoebophrya sp. A120]|eukprot:GSA120T00023944001.1